MTVDTVLPAQTFGTLTSSSTVMPNTVVAGATTPPSANISNGGTTNDASPRIGVPLNSALGVGEFLRVKRNGVAVTIVSSVSCGTNCFLLEVPAPVALTTNDSGSLSLLVPGTAGLPTTAPVYSVVVVDAAGNEGAASAAFSIAFNYFVCDFVRADATHRAVVGAQFPHAAWTPALNCAGCHTSGQANQQVATPSGTMLAVPVTTPAYWCRRP